MVVRLKTIDTGAINIEAINKFVDTLSTLKGQQRDREITSNLGRIERDSQLRQNVIMGRPDLDEESQLREVSEIRQNARVRKLDFITQSGEFTPPSRAGIGGFLDRIGGALDPTNTQGITETPLIRAIQSRLVTQEFPTPTERARTDALRLRGQAQQRTGKDIVETINQLTDQKAVLEENDKDTTQIDAKIARNVDELAARHSVPGAAAVPKAKGVSEKPTGTLGKIKNVAQGAFDFLGKGEPSGEAASIASAITGSKPVAQKQPRKKTRTKAERDRLQAIFEQMTPEELAIAEEALSKKLKTPEEIADFFEANS